ncbi:MAG: M48 family metallopeptidase [Eubacterium sp.]|nr:M48 family metallopeptidase [Eubacterium sp.]
MKNIRLAIKSDGSIRVSADTSVSLDNIEKFLIEKINWIEKHRVIPSQVPELCDNMTLYLFGEAFVLKITKLHEESVNIINNVILTGLPQPENIAAVERLLISEIAAKGREIFSGLLKEFLGSADWRGTPPALSIKLLSSKWGHYSKAKHEIMINIAVCGLPFDLARYLAAHETAHLIIGNHQKEFYALGEKLLPGFKKFDRELSKYRPDLWKNIISAYNKPI